MPRQGAANRACQPVEGEHAHGGRAGRPTVSNAQLPGSLDYAGEAAEAATVMLTNTRTCATRTCAATPSSTRVNVESETNEAHNLAHSDAGKIAISPTRECKRG
eukprot:4113362-Alexandrium_andersonii.AAC.1